MTTIGMTDEKNQNIDYCPDDGPITAATATSVGEEEVIDEEESSKQQQATLSINDAPPVPSSLFAPLENDAVVDATVDPPATAGRGGGGRRNVAKIAGAVVKDTGLAVQKGLQQATVKALGRARKKKTNNEETSVDGDDDEFDSSKKSNSSHAKQGGDDDSSLLSSSLLSATSSNTASTTRQGPGQRFQAMLKKRNSNNNNENNTLENTTSSLAMMPSSVLDLPVEEESVTLRQSNEAKEKATSFTEAAVAAIDNRATTDEAVTAVSTANTIATETTTKTTAKTTRFVKEPANSTSSSSSNGIAIFIICTLIASSAVACFQTWQHWSIIFCFQGEDSSCHHRLIPLSVTVAWMVFAYTTGSTITLAAMMVTNTTTTHTTFGNNNKYIIRKSRHARASMFAHDGINATSSVDDDDDENDDAFVTARSGNDLQEGEFQKKNVPARLLANIWSKITPGQSRNKQEHQRPKEQYKKPKQQKKPRWTMLNKNKRNLKLPKWQRTIDPLQSTLTTADADDEDDEDCVSGNHRLMQKLLSERNLQQVPRHVSTFAQDTQELTATTTSTRLGGFSKSTVMAKTLDDYVIDPILKLRGMDVFTNPNALDEIDESLRGSIGSHPWLIQHGLRSVPTLIINIMFGWGNLIVYFEMPSWLTDFTDASLLEKPDDESDVKALKRFLKANDEYRNERLKCIPSLVIGPLAVRILAPPKSEVAIHGTVIPLSWTCHEADDQYVLPAKADDDDDDEDGLDNSSTISSRKKLCPALECEVDCLSGRTIRNMSGIIKRNLSSLVLDIALVIGASATPAAAAAARSGSKQQQPGNNEDDNDNLQACLGMWRFNRIDIESCSEFPDRSMYQDVIKENPTAVNTTGSRHDDDVDIMKKKHNHLELSRRRRDDILMASRIVGLNSVELNKMLLDEEEEEE